jgi:hypothetical protein
MTDYEIKEDKYYAYFFTRQDIFPEYQLVQTAHAALKLGYHAAEKWDKGQEETLREGQIKTFNPSETYFTCVGVRDLDAIYAVEAILQKFGFKYEVFVEPDIGNEITSIAVYPVHEDKRDILLAFSLLKFGGKG